MALAGERFGAFTLRRYLGVRRSGELWAGVADDGADVLVQVDEVDARQEDRARARVAEVISTALAVRHANLVRILDGGVVAGRRFVVMERSEGADLARILAQATREGWWPSPGLSGYVVHEVARVLTHAHAHLSSGRPAVHLAISPRTITVEPSGAVKLAELMGALDSQALTRTAGTGQSGGLGYVSPELAFENRVAPPADIFALGAVLWTLLTGAAPYARATDLETLTALRSATLPALPGAVPEELGAIARDCLARDPETRPTAANLTRRLAATIVVYPEATPGAARALYERARAPKPPTSQASWPPAPTPPVRARTVQVPTCDRAPGATAAAPGPAPALGLDPQVSDTAAVAVTPPLLDDPFSDPRRDVIPWPAGRFQVIERLGSGGMGEVYRVRDRELDEIVALKLIPRESTAELRSIERLRREVRLARRIASPFVCRIHDIVDIGNGVRGLTMAFVEGVTLSDMMRNGVALDYRRFARWGADMAEGLAAAHDLAIIHRDLKPENVMIRADDRAVILDFGIALSAELSAPPAAKLTQAGMIMGTPLYMSPEQILTLPLDGRSDLFALGLMLAELITGEVPMRGSTYAELLERRWTKAERFRLRDVDAGAPEPLAAIVDALLATTAELRPATALEVARQLRAFEAGASLTASPSSPAPPGPPAPPAAAAAPDTPKPAVAADSPGRPRSADPKIAAAPEAAAPDLAGSPPVRPARGVPTDEARLPPAQPADPPGPTEIRPAAPPTVPTPVEIPGDTGRTPLPPPRAGASVAIVALGILALALSAALATLALRHLGLSESAPPRGEAPVEHVLLPTLAGPGRASPQAADAGVRAADPRPRPRPEARLPPAEQM